jgi:hypothetical protein
MLSFLPPPQGKKEENPKSAFYDFCNHFMCVKVECCQMFWWEANSSESYLQKKYYPIALVKD